MASLWIIDGFNLIRQSRDLDEIESLDFEKAQQILVDRLKKFAQTSREKVLCVFDATGSIQKERREEGHGAVKVVFTRGGETADEYIIEQVTRLREAAIVVSSDREIVEACQKRGSSSMSSTEFDQLLFCLQNRHFPEEDEKEGFDPRRGTQKKGPAYRRPKKERKVYAKIKRWI